MEYRLNIGGNATVPKDSLGPHKGCSFGAWDEDPSGICSAKIGGGWWYSAQTECDVCSNFSGVFPNCEYPQPLGMKNWKYLDFTSPTNSNPTSS
ncbi:unnamed protein product [Pocillopora meandrina]|uniref:Fibrinogen C-terminal domain-containing protein n=1 Tax=Pocillopora meandrina TaxID=46732 RepID=A0AAU9XSV1_9CNID|nr:unnamed protein product [Pocillopora meandrina]